MEKRLSEVSIKLSESKLIEVSFLLKKDYQKSILIWSVDFWNRILTKGCLLFEFLCTLGFCISNKSIELNVQTSKKIKKLILRI